MLLLKKCAAQFSTLDFGTIGRDEIFSRDIACGQGAVLFDERSGHAIFKLDTDERICLRPGMVQYAVRNKSRLVFGLTRPPTLESPIQKIQDDESTDYLNFRDLVSEILRCGYGEAEGPSRIRVEGFSPEHVKIAPFLSLNFCVNFDSSDSLDVFCSSARELGFRQFQNHPFQTRSSDISYDTALASIHQWLKNHRSLPLTYQVYAMLWSGHVLLAEALALLPLIDQLLL